MQPYLKIIGNGQRTARDLTSQEAEATFMLVMDGKASLPQVAAMMAALRIREESADELATFTSVLRRYCQTTQVDSPYLVDICIPYDGRSRRLSMIPLAALIAASAGAKVALHGRVGQNTPPKFGVGVGDVLAQLGLPVNASVSAAADLLRNEAIGVAYVDVTQFAPTLERFNSVRFDYGMRSFFNTIEKLINPFTAPNAIVGVFHGPVLERVAGAMQAQGYQRGLAVQGSEGAIEVLTSRRTPTIEFGMNGDSTLQAQSIDPTEFGWWDRADNTEITVTPAANAELTLQLLDPNLNIDAPILSAYQHTALLTAALIVYVSGKEASFSSALIAVQAAFASGDVAQRLVRWQAAASVPIHPIVNGETDHGH